MIISTNLTSDFLDRFFETPKYEGSYPKTDVRENETEHKLLISVPGLSKEDLKITIKEGALNVSYVKEEKNEKSYFMKSFSKSYGIPDDVSESQIEAKVENGILIVVFPKDKKKITERIIDIL